MATKSGCSGLCTPHKLTTTDLLSYTMPNGTVIVACASCMDDLSVRSLAQAYNPAQNQGNQNT